PKERVYAQTMKMVAEHFANSGVADGLEAIPFNVLGFGLFAPGRSSDENAPYIGVWFDEDSVPMYWVQIRARQGIDGAMLACEECHGVEHAAAFVRQFIPRLMSLSGT